MTRSPLYCIVCAKTSTVLLRAVTLNDAHRICRDSIGTGAPVYMIPDAA